MATNPREGDANFSSVRERILKLTSRFADVLPTVPHTANSKSQMVADGARLKTFANIVLSPERDTKLSKKDADLIHGALNTAETALDLLALVSLEEGEPRRKNELEVAAELDQLERADIEQLMTAVAGGLVGAEPRTQLLLMGQLGGIAMGLKEVLLAVIKLILLLVLLFLKYIGVVDWTNIARFAVWAIRVDNWDSSESEAGATDEGPVVSTPDLPTFFMGGDEVVVMRHCQWKIVDVQMGDRISIEHAGGSDGGGGQIPTLEIEVLNSDGTRRDQQDINSGQRSRSWLGPCKVKIHAENGRQLGTAACKIHIS